MFQFLMTLATALTISAVAAYFSVLGIIAIFASTPVSAAVMAGTLEVGKLVTAAWLHENFSDKGNRALKFYLIVATLVLMLITSMGIFGFLSKSFMDHAVVAGPQQERIALVQEQIQRLDERKQELKSELSSQNRYVDVYLGAGNVRDAKRGVALANRQRATRQAISTQLDAIEKERTALSEELLSLNANYRKIEAEVGPVVYLAEAVYGERSNEVVDKAVRWVIFLIMFSFDPLAVLLLIAALVSLNKYRNSKIQTDIPSVILDDIINKPDNTPEFPEQTMVEMEYNPFTRTYKTIKERVVQKKNRLEERFGGKRKL